MSQSDSDLLSIIPSKLGVISDLYVEDEYRGKNIGTLLMEKIEEYLKQLGCDAIWIDIVAFNSIAHQFYNKLGYVDSGGLFSPLTFADTDEKRQVIWYSLLSFGFLPLLSPLTLIPLIGDLATYFVIANHLPGAQGLAGQYRVTLTPFLAWGTILTISRFQRLNKWYITVYLFISAIFVSYVLHEPLSYLTKQWFWIQPSGVKSINTMIQTYLPTTASVVSQNNITPHISHRDKIYTLYPEKRDFSKNSPCGEPTCDWFRWYGSPEFLIVNTSPEWDARHLLTDRPLFLKGLQNIEKTKVVTIYKNIGSTILYKVNENPDDYK